MTSLSALSHELTEEKMSRSSDFWANKPNERRSAQRVYERATDGGQGPDHLLRNARIVTGLGLADDYGDILRDRISAEIQRMEKQPFTSGDEALAAELMILAEAMEVLERAS